MSSPYGDSMNLSALSMLISNFTCEFEIGDDEELVARLAGPMFEHASSCAYAHDLGEHYKYHRITTSDKLQWLQIYYAAFANRSYTELMHDQDERGVFFRFTRDKKQVLEFLRTLRRLQRGIPVTPEARNHVLEHCKLAQRIVRELASAAHFWEGQQDDDD